MWIAMKGSRGCSMHAQIGCRLGSSPHFFKYACFALITHCCPINYSLKKQEVGLDLLLVVTPLVSQWNLPRAVADLAPPEMLLR